MSIAGKSIIRALTAAIAMVAALIVGVQPAHAYGTGHVYQLTYSLNCDNKTSPDCAPPPQGFGLGGAWGWIEADSGQTADATMTFCSHSQGPAGAQHANVSDVAWTIVSGSALNGAFTAGTDPNDQYIAFPNGPLAFVAFPATPGHYATTFAPGVQAQETVILMH